MQGEGGRGPEVFDRLEIGTMHQLGLCLWLHQFMCKNLLAVTNQKKRKSFVFSIVIILLF